MMVDAPVSLVDMEKYGPKSLRPRFYKGTVHYTMILHLMCWLKTNSIKDVTELAISELYARERDLRVSNRPKS